MKPRRYRNRFHTFALSDTEEKLLRNAEKIAGRGLTDTLINALNAYVQATRRNEPVEKTPSFFEVLEEFFRK